MKFIKSMGKYFLAGVIFLKIVILDRIFGFFIRKIIPLKKADNILILISGGVGDTAILTSVLKHYREFFKNQKIYLIANTQNQALELLENKFSDETTEINFRKLKLNYKYAWKIISKLRRIGFEKVIYTVVVGRSRLSPLFYGIADIKYAYILSEPCYLLKKGKNFYQQFEERFIDPTTRKYFKNSIPYNLPEFRDRSGLLTSVISQQKLLLEGITGKKFDNFSSLIPISQLNVSQEVIDAVKSKFFLLAPGAGLRIRWWPIDRFVEICKRIQAKDPSMRCVVIGSKQENDLGEVISKNVPNVINLIGKTTIKELKFLISKSEFVLCNDTGFVHLAIALKKPSVAIIGWDEGLYSHYGYPKINKWVTNKKYSSFFENKEFEGAPIPYNDNVQSPDYRYLSISTEMVWDKVNELMNTIKNKEDVVPQEDEFVF